MLDNQGIDGLIGRTFKGYRVTRFIARGGMGIVFEGVQESLDRPVAIKFLYPHLSDDDRFRERFEREARAAARLDHPNIVRILDFGSEGPLHYMILDLVDGESLRDRLARIHTEGLTLRTDTIIDILRQVGSALSEAHRHGYVHRDVKPGNILLTDDGRAFLTDFGVVKVLGSTQMTSTGTMIGTPEYMAPEQSAGTTEIGPAADLYSLAIIAYEMMTGRVPFQAPTPVAVMRMHLSEPPPPPSSIVPTFPSAVESVLIKALSKDPDDRYESVDAFIESLATAADSSSYPAAATPPHGQSVAAYMAGVSDAGRQSAVSAAVSEPARSAPPPRPPAPRARRPSPPPAPQGHRRMAVGGGAIALLLAAILLGMFATEGFGIGDDDSNEGDVAGDETPTPTAAVPTLTSTLPPTATATSHPTTATAASPSPTATYEATATAEATVAATEPASPYATTAMTTTGNEGTLPAILFVADRGDSQSSQIYAMNPDGSDQRQITSIEGQSRNPHISPSGDAFVFSSATPPDEGGYGAAGDGAEEVRHSDIYIADASGQNVTNLTTNSTSWDSVWAWSPDGATIAFTSNRDGNQEIYTMTRDGANLRRVTNDPAKDGWSSWTPDGKRMVFASDRGGDMEIYIMNTDGSSVQQLTDRPGMVDTYPVVSPDGTRIAFASQNPETGVSEIYVMGVDGSYVTQLTNAGGMNSAPSWSPDGEQIVFVSDRDGNRNIYRMNADGSGQTDGSDQTRLIDNPGEDTSPNWTYIHETDGSQQY